MHWRCSIPYARTHEHTCIPRYSSLLQNGLIGLLRVHFLFAHACGLRKRGEDYASESPCNFDYHFQPDGTKTSRRPLAPDKPKKIELVNTRRRATDCLKEDRKCSGNLTSPASRNKDRKMHIICLYFITIILFPAHDESLLGWPDDDKHATKVCSVGPMTTNMIHSAKKNIEDDKEMIRNTRDKNDFGKLRMAQELAVMKK